MLYCPTHGGSIKVGNYPHTEAQKHGTELKNRVYSLCAAVPLCETLTINVKYKVFITLYYGEPLLWNNFQC